MGCYPFFIIVTVGSVFKMRDFEAAAKKAVEALAEVDVFAQTAFDQKVGWYVRPQEPLDISSVVVDSEDGETIDVPVLDL